ncbi:MAG TPA: hypothetical protein ACFYED_09120 [Candidatus Tripitaka californicus]|uniref:hypothetical protein n=1 Tax=Candidatus Tripitaka californicus TaxID=3367616 RepID=UPI0040254C95|nr:hypothetical protein [Planctomycetota bacterium]
MDKAKVVRKKGVLADFERLSKRRKGEVADFVAYLKVKEELEATKEILSDKALFKSIVKGDEDFKTGRSRRWSEVKRSL